MAKKELITTCRVKLRNGELLDITVYKQGCQWLLNKEPVQAQNNGTIEGAKQEITVKYNIPSENIEERKAV